MVAFRQYGDRSHCRQQGAAVGNVLAFCKRLAFPTEAKMGILPLDMPVIRKAGLMLILAARARWRHSAPSAPWLVPQSSDGSMLLVSDR